MTKSPIRLFFDTIRSKVIFGDDLSDKDTIILVMGTAGSGKTSFINTVSQKANLKVANDLSGGTKKLSPVRCNSKSETPRIVLVDSPPFPDDSGEAEILTWLKNIKRKSMVKGVLFLHSIKANRGQPEEEYKRLRRMSSSQLGGVPVILVTTFWSSNPSETHKTRQSSLEEKWESARIDDDRPTIQMYDNTMDSAWNIVDAILKKAGIDLSEA